MNTFFSFLFLFATSFLVGNIQTPLQKRMLSDIDFITDAFSVKYAPMQWKEKNFGWNLEKERQALKETILTKPEISLKDFQYALKGFFNNVKDYHVGVTFYSTECATLPFLVKKAEGKYFVSYVDKEELLDSSLIEGDEIVTFDSRPIDEVIQEIKKKEVGTNMPETDQALAELLLTHRCGHRGNSVPKGKISIGVKQYGNLTTLPLSWKYTPEKVTAPSQIHLPLTQSFPVQKTKTFKGNDFFKKMMVYPYINFSDREALANPHALGATRSFIPILGQKIWESEEDSPFDAYIFEMPGGFNIPEGAHIGYVRIPHYVADIEEVNDFKEIMLVFRDNVDALIIDQINNPGGSVFYLYSLASCLTDRPLKVPRHHIALTQQEVHMAANLLDALEDVTDDETARAILGEEIGGYPVDFSFSIDLKLFCEMLLKEWNGGHFYSQATPLFGVDEIKPNREIGFDRPILLLTNSLDFSGGDFFPAIMQDNQRATIFGEKTAGAGGYVIATHYANRLGICHFSLTGSLAERTNQEPIENRGVKPDISYSLTKKDLEDNYSDYVYHILLSLEEAMR